jgi:2-polyprenyl-3-methyl-5-hydroxy-6-metoxy-1,4-benzoquinol methylase
MIQMGHTELAKKLWDSETYKYDEKNKVTFPRVLAIANEIKKTKLGNRVLDFGCGLGILHRILGEEYQYYGCDISHKVVQMHNNPNIVECDLDHDPLPFKDKRFSYVVCSGIIEYLADVGKFLRDINQHYGHEECLFLITVSNATLLWNRVTMLEGHFPITSPLSDNVNFFSPKDFLKLLLECQFKVLRNYPTSYAHCEHHTLRSILGRAFPSLFGDQFLYVCMKGC